MDVRQRIVIQRLILILATSRSTAFPAPPPKMDSTNSYNAHQSPAERCTFEPKPVLDRTLIRRLALQRRIAELALAKDREIIGRMARHHDTIQRRLTEMEEATHDRMVEGNCDGRKLKRMLAKFRRMARRMDVDRDFERHMMEQCKENERRLAEERVSEEQYLAQFGETPASIGRRLENAPPPTVGNRVLRGRPPSVSEEVDDAAAAPAEELAPVRRSERLSKRARSIYGCL